MNEGKNFIRPKSDFRKYDGVSAVVSTYNSERFIRQRMENLLEQTLYAQGRLEIIVIDACSPQKEGDIVREFSAEYPNIRYTRTETREGLYASWNRGYAAARGAFLINANTDDRFSKDALERLAAPLLEDQTISATYGNWLMTDIENDTFDSPSEKFLFEYPEFFPPLFLYFQITSHAAMIRRTTFDEVGPFDETFKVFGDREWMLRFSSTGYTARKVDETVGLYLVNPGGIEFSDSSGANEFEVIRRQFTEPGCLHLLFGRSEKLSPKESADLYATAGSLGNKFYQGRDGWVSDLAFASTLLGRAIKLDPTNVVALNNLAAIYMTASGWKFAEALLKGAAAIAGPDRKPLILANRERLSHRRTDLDDFVWLR